jgi:hypothetical protein
MKVLELLDNVLMESRLKTPKKTDKPTVNFFSLPLKLKTTSAVLSCSKKPSMNKPRMELTLFNSYPPVESFQASKLTRVPSILVVLTEKKLLKVSMVLLDVAKLSMKRDADLPNGELF